MNYLTLINQSYKKNQLIIIYLWIECFNWLLNWMNCLERIDPIANVINWKSIKCKWIDWDVKLFHWARRDQLQRRRNSSSAAPFKQCANDPSAILQPRQMFNDVNRKFKTKKNKKKNKKMIEIELIELKLKYWFFEMMK